MEGAEGVGVVGATFLFLFWYIMTRMMTSTIIAHQKMNTKVPTTYPTGNLDDDELESVAKTLTLQQSHKAVRSFISC